MAKIYVNFRCDFGVVHNSVMFQTEKTIKYIRLYYTGHNRVGDKIEWNPTVEERFMGPFNGTGYFLKRKLQADGWQYANDLETVSLDCVVVDYMDGTSETIDGAYIGNFEVPRQEQPIETKTNPMNPILKVLLTILLVVIIGFIILGIIGNLLY